MSKYAVINLKTDPELKKAVTNVAEKLGVSVSAVLNNELRRFAIEQRVVFDLPEVPNAKTASLMKKSQNEIEKGDYNKFENKEESEAFLKNLLK
jgi:addiction module RelB/DinJ family antitoxin